MFNINSKTSGATLSVISNIMLVMMKFVVGFITGSVSVISEAIHSLMDLLAALLALFSIKIADKPPDEMHPYGHEKIENISGVIEALLIVAASG
jgi:cation diffusion facilitator family transporter